MLSEVEIERRLAGQNIPAEGRELIRKIRAGVPIRNLQLRTDNVRTRLISKKMQRALWAESRTVEMPAIRMYEHCKAIDEMWPQPTTIDLVVQGLKNGHTRITHTPDLFLVGQAGFVFEEWREEERLQHFAKDRPHHFQKDADGRWHYLPAEDFFDKRGLKYRLRSADELPRIYIANIHFLEDYSHESTPVVPTAIVARLKALLKIRNQVPHLELIYKHGFSADHIFQMVLNDEVYVDVHAQRLDLTDDLRIYSEKIIYEAESLISNAQPRPLPSNALAVRAGNRFLYDGKTLEIVLSGTKEIIVRDEAGSTFPLEVSLVQRLLDKNQVVGLPETNVAEREYDLAKVIANQKKLRVAIERYKALREPATATVSDRTLRRWRKKTAGVRSPQELLTLLAPENPGNTTSRLSPEVVELARRAVAEHHNKAANPPVSATFAVYVTLCADVNVLPMSRSAFYEWIKPHEDVRAREGKRAAYQKEAIPLYFDHHHPVHGVRPHEIVYCDSTVANIFAAGRVMPNLGKPTTCVAVDGATNQARALYTTFDPASADTTLMLMRDYVRRQGRLPDTIVLDNGPEYKNAALLEFCDLYDVHTRWRRRAKPRDSNMVERLFGITEEEILSSMAGNTIALKNPRNVSKEVSPENHIEWTLPAFHGAYDHFLFSLYPNRIHPRFGVSMADYEKRLLLECGSRNHIVVRYDSTLKLLTSPHSGKHTRKIDNRNGVYVDGMYYWNNRLSMARAGEEAEVRCEMWCARVVYVCFRGEWVIAQARDGGSLEGRFLHEIEIARRAESRARKAAAQRDRSSARVSREKTKLWTPELWDPRIREQAVETYALYERLGMTEVFEESKNERAHLLDVGHPGRSKLLIGVESEASEGRKTVPADVRLNDISDDVYF